MSRYDHYGFRVAGSSLGCALFAAAWLALTVGADTERGGVLPADLAWVGTPWAATVTIALACALFLGG